jgi:O-antigen/teichoic acid export membrane protein
VEKLLSIVVNLTVGIYVIRYLGSDNFGKLSYCLSIPLLSLSDISY